MQISTGVSASAEIIDRSNHTYIGTHGKIVVSGVKDVEITPEMEVI
jgi:hypothetical protein